MDEQGKMLLSKRKDRTIAIILNYKEQECDKYLPPDLRLAFRKKILDQINDFYDLALDVAASTSDGVILNEIYLDKIDEIYARLNGK